MSLTKQLMIILAVLSLLGGCASSSEKSYRLAEQSMKQGDYSAAFDQAVSSLNAEIGNHKAIALFPELAESAYAQKFTEIEYARSSGELDRVAYGYDRIIAMNQAVAAIRDSLTLYAPRVSVTKAKRQAMNTLLAMQPHDVSELHDQAYKSAAASHYTNAGSHANAKNYRQASHEYNRALSFIPGYRDAVALAAKTKGLADLADARLYYGQGKQAVQNHQHRAAAEAFARAESFVRGFRNAHVLALRYKDLADREDALASYLEGERLVGDHHYREAAAAFERALSFVPNFRDAAALALHYSDLANREDARRFYIKGERLMDRQDFDQAAQAFDQADHFVPGFRNARALAERARAFIAPGHFELRTLVQESVEHGIPLRWLHDVHHGYAEDVKVTNIRIIRQGRFNTVYEYWPYRLQVTGVCDLEVANGEEKKLSFDTVVDYRIFRDDFNEWRATFR